VARKDLEILVALTDAIASLTTAVNAVVAEFSSSASLATELAAANATIADDQANDATAETQITALTAQLDALTTPTVPVPAPDPAPAQ
jgi:hypothetical protein